MTFSISSHSKPSNLPPILYDTYNSFLIHPTIRHREVIIKTTQTTNKEKTKQKHILIMSNYDHSTSNTTKQEMTNRLQNKFTC